jgi:hypothetical protein
MIPQLSVTCVTISEEERPSREAAMPRLEGLKLGTLEYAEAIQALGPALGHHYLASGQNLTLGTHAGNIGKGRIPDVRP